MFLILDQYPTEFSLRLKKVAELKGLKTLLLTSAEIVHDLALSFYISDQDINLHLEYRNISIETCDIEGVYCGINAFEERLWKRFSPKNAGYAARETQALWLAILASLPCRIVNPPALDTLAGTLLSTPEILDLAHQHGFQIPMVVNLESGSVAVELLASGVPAHYADLGHGWINESALRKDDLSILSQNENHFRVVEKIPGKSMYVTLVSDEFFACAPDAKGSVMSVSTDQVPSAIRARLQTLQKQLNLKVAEYHFRILADETWVFSGYERPPNFAVAAYGDLLFEQIAKYITKKGG